MSMSVVKVIELIGESPDSWEDAVKVALKTAS
ncbi:dodecin domain-containing protein, partial [Candidatus Thorarchaeota archaeon]